ncbi:MAG: hypothetical protein UIQ90_04370 [Eisenbergiella sp.]
MDIRGCSAGSSQDTLCATFKER